MKKYAMMMLLFAVALVAGGCEGKEEPMPETAVASIVTYESTREQTSVFTYTDNLGQLITLTAAWAGNEELKPGARVLIYYRAEAYGVSGSISLLSVTPVPGGEPVVADAAAIPASEALQQCTAWLSGNYLNLSSVITFQGNASEVSLYVDEATEAWQMPSVYVVVRAGAENLSPGAERSLYASWNVAAFTGRDTFEGFNVYFTDAANKTQTIKITK